MLRRYPWHFAVLLMAIATMTNLFQKIQWQEWDDGILWQSSERGLLCLQSPQDAPILPGDLLLSIDRYTISSPVDLKRILPGKMYHRYEVERDGLLKDVGVDMVIRHTPVTYFVLALGGLTLLILCLNMLNAALLLPQRIHPPPAYLVFALSFSGLLLFSPTGTYQGTDWLFFALNLLCQNLFPSALLICCLHLPIRTPIVKRLWGRTVSWLIWLTPWLMLLLLSWPVLNNLRAPIVFLALREELMAASQRLALLHSLFLLLAGLALSGSTLHLIRKKGQRQYRLPLILTLAGLTATLTLLLPPPLLNLSSALTLPLSLLLLLLPLGVTVFLSPKKIPDVSQLIRKTLTVGFLLTLVFGLYFFLGQESGPNRVLSLFWSLAALLLAGYLIRPIERDLHAIFERLFFPQKHSFKKRLSDLTRVLMEERDLDRLAERVLNTLNQGLDLQTSALLVHVSENQFQMLPEKQALSLSPALIRELQRGKALALDSAEHLQITFPEEDLLLTHHGFHQFMPLRTQRSPLIGLFAFGPKKDTRRISLEEWELIQSVASPLGLAVENAFLYSRLEKQLQEIKLLKEYNENIIENLNLGIVVLSELDTIQTWNAFMEIKWGIPRNQALSQNAAALFGGEIWNLIAPLKGQIASVEDDRGQTRRFQFHISPLRDDQGDTLGTILVVEDISEKIRIQNQLITSEKMASIGLLSAGIAHEINTPLTGISSYCQLILENPEDPENLPLIQRIQEQVVRANRITRTLLDFSRQKGELPQPVALHTVLDQCLALLDHRLRQKSIELERSYLCREPIWGFSTRLQQLFINLIINSLDALEETPHPWLSLSVSSQEQLLAVEVADNGPGMDSDHLARIFEPFFTTKEPGKGTGLGLSIAYTIIKEHEGTISVSSTRGEGTRFTIHFPFQSPLRRDRHATHHPPR